VWLRKKLERRTRPAPATTPTFVEVPIEMVVQEAETVTGKNPGNPDRGSTGSVIEVASPDGTRMRIQLGTDGLDAAKVIAAFLGRSR